MVDRFERSLGGTVSIFEDVRQFMEIGHPDKIAKGPCIPSEAIDDLCQTLIKEERKELNKAWADEDLVEISDAIADLIYVLIFMALCYGIPIKEVWEEVAKTNMAKFPGGVVLRREGDGKIMKPPGWVPPDIKGIIEQAIARAKSNPSPEKQT
jgi:predicted HAD superfamily Cof-like phosphohydrolase